ncbi:MAG: diaminobutyrate-2-oxoglutarate transaminase [Bermanella sp.]|jgi:diaminobutyrate-2-oxoglutarate transaminase
MTIFDKLESEVQSYARSFPVTFDKALGAKLYDTEGREYIDFLAGAGTLNYGHNHPVLKKALIEYLENDGITHGLDMHTRAKKELLEAFDQCILKPRDLQYILQFPGPTGTNAVEAAMKIARKVKGRSEIISFTNGFHGCTLGALAATGNRHHRGGSGGVSLPDVTHMPFCDYYGKDIDTLKMIDQLIEDPSSGVDQPAAVILETVQGEGGLNAASFEWLQGVEKLCKKHDMLMIVDDIQAGCGRTGTFFSFEPAGIKPDIVTLSKSLSGFGLPFALVMMRPELDIWEPGEHNGTFRGNNHAFITAATAIRHFWSDDKFAKEIELKSQLLGRRFQEIANMAGPTMLQPKGRGMMQGLSCKDGELAKAIITRCFEQGLVIETSGAYDQVVKCLCPLTITDDELNKALDIIEQSVKDIITKRYSKAS